MKRAIIISMLLAMVFGITAFQCSSTEITSAKLYLNQDQTDKAKEALEREIKANPKSDEGFYLLGYIHGEEGDITKMLEMFENSLSISPKFAKDINDQKLYYWADGFNKGVGFFNKAGKAATEDEANGFMDKSIESFKSSIACQPDSADTYSNLIIAYINTGRYDEAIPPLEKLIELKNSADSYSKLGDIYHLQGTELMRQYEESGNVQDSVDAMAAYNKAITTLEKGNTLYPDDYDNLVVLTQVYISANKLDQAVKKLEALVVKDPENKIVRYNYGVLLLSDEKYDVAEIQFKKAIELDPEYINAIYNLGVTYYRWGVRLREKAELAEVNDESYKEKLELALPYLEQYIQTDPENGIMWDLLGRIYANIGMQQESIDAFDKADLYR